MNTQQAKDINIDNQKPTTLTIVQDFQKKKSASHSSHNIEMVQGKSKDFSIEPNPKEKSAEINDESHP